MEILVRIHIQVKTGILAVPLVIPLVEPEPGSKQPGWAVWWTWGQSWGTETSGQCERTSTRYKY